MKYRNVFPEGGHATNYRLARRVVALHYGLPDPGDSQDHILVLPELGRAHVSCYTSPDWAMVDDPQKIGEGETKAQAITRWETFGTKIWHSADTLLLVWDCPTDRRVWFFPCDPVDLYRRRSAENRVRVSWQQVGLCAGKRAFAIEKDLVREMVGQLK